MHSIDYIKAMNERAAERMKADPIRVTEEIAVQAVEAGNVETVPPTWLSVIPMLVACIERGPTFQPAYDSAVAELRRLATIADRANHEG